MKITARDKSPKNDQPAPSSDPVSGVQPESVKGEVLLPAKRRPSFLRRAFRWLLFSLVLFGAGALVITLFFYLPLRAEQNQQVRAREAELAAAHEQIAALESRAAALSPLEATASELEEDLAQANLHIAIVKARSDVLSARLALASDEPAKAITALTTTPDTLEKMADQLEPEQKDLVASMLQRLELARAEIEDNPFAAQSDLNVLESSLLELEHALF